ncbi:PREDICTED: uncharacterized protein LOC108360922 [Rhagoletis zephyria]|uniref:uncharacterized protein LOC108360922 n=1 Tax=Rhagoletis zephyria TaxID=28612 RepID=UPI0008117ED0|nr:PREDICTED: uncharacterized protein LOC108360922 [Rhagoletis zephyria]
MPLAKIIGTKPTVAEAAEVALRLAESGESPRDVQPEGSAKVLQRRITDESDTQIRLQIKEVEDDTPEGVRAMRKGHSAFVGEVHAHALGYLLFAILQWQLLYQIEGLVKFVNSHYYISLIPFTISYVMLMCLVFFYNLLSQGRSKVRFYVYTGIMLQLATVAIAMPISTSTNMHLVYSSIVSSIVIISSIVLACCRQDYILHKPEFIFIWTGRCFVITSMGIIVAISLKSPYFDMVMTLIMIFFMSIYILICGRVLSRAEFVWLDKYGPHMYGTLFYMNYMTLYSMCVLLFEQIERVTNQ